MEMKELAAIGIPRQNKSYPNLWAARHKGTEKMTVLNTENGAHITVDMAEGWDAQAALETWFSEHGIAPSERREIERRAHAAKMVGKARIDCESTSEDGVAEHDVEPVTVNERVGTDDIIDQIEVTIEEEEFDYDGGK